MSLIELAPSFSSSPADEAAHQSHGEPDREKEDERFDAETDSGALRRQGPANAMPFGS
ncbi:hypothetical protein [Mesorhizobium sp. KR1-2]|uniref:hypothetical protein n=1 Tax=Mesorhizobium sp. KR1-2 TaxID=3156609 RepID=UPI0032B537F3